jgi:hypothetical protein
MSEESNEEVQKEPVGEPQQNTPVLTPTDERSWSRNGTGRMGKEIEHDGYKFSAKQVKKSDLRRYGRSERNLSRQLIQLKQAQDDEITALEKAEKERAEKANEKPRLVTLSDDRHDYYADETERVTDQLDGAYDDLLIAGLTGWKIPPKFTAEAIRDLPMPDKFALCQEIGARSSFGFNPAKN